MISCNAAIADNTIVKEWTAQNRQMRADDKHTPYHCGLCSTPLVQAAKVKNPLTATLPYLKKHT